MSKSNTITTNAIKFKINGKIFKWFPVYYSENKEKFFVNEAGNNHVRFDTPEEALKFAENEIKKRMDEFYK